MKDLSGIDIAVPVKENTPITSVTLNTITGTYLPSTWGSIVGTITSQSDLIALLAGYQTTLTFGNAVGVTNRTTVSGGTGAVIGAGIFVDVATNLLPSPILTDTGKVLTATGANTAIWTTPTGLVIGSPAGGLNITGNTLTLVSANGSTTGALTSSDWNTFNNKQSTLTLGNLTGTTNRTTVSGGSGSVVGSGASVDIATALLPSPVLADAGKVLTATGANTAAWTVGADALVKISAGDATAGYLVAKLVSGTGITLTDLGSTLQITNSDTGSAAITTHLLAYDHTAIFHSNRSALDLVSGTNTGDETTVSIKTKLGTASSSTDGYLTSTDWNTFNNKLNSFTSGNLTESSSSVLTITGGTNAVVGTGTSIQVKQASGVQNGFLSFTDWNTFNNKQGLLHPGNIGTATTGLTITNGAASTVGPNVDIEIATASATQTGLLTATDWNAFNAKQTAISIGNLTGTAGRVILTGGTGSVIGSGTSVDIATALLPTPLLADTGKALVATGVGTAAWSPVAAGSSNGWAGMDYVALTDMLTVDFGRQAHVFGSILIDGILNVDGKLFQFDENFG